MSWLATILQALCHALWVRDVITWCEGKDWLGRPLDPDDPNLRVQITQRIGGKLVAPRRSEIEIDCWRLFWVALAVVVVGSVLYLAILDWWCNRIAAVAGAP
jgi:hypothetical protein